MKLQWSIQSSHTQSVLSQVVYLNYRNENLWPPTWKWLQILEVFHLASIQIITFDHFWTIHLILRLVRKFFIFQYWEWAFGFLSIIHFNKKSLSLFPSQILVCAMAFAAHNLFSFWDLHFVRLNSINYLVGFIPC